MRFEQRSLATIFRILNVFSKGCLLYLVLCTKLIIEVFEKILFRIPVDWSCKKVCLVKYSSTQVWAAGFSTALLKKSSSTTYCSSKTGGGTQPRNGKNESQIEEKEPFFIETILLVAFEKLFSYLLNFPDINQ